jgi:hypothetical protein
VRACGRAGVRACGRAGVRACGVRRACVFVCGGGGSKHVSGQVGAVAPACCHPLQGAWLAGGPGCRPTRPRVAPPLGTLHCPPRGELCSDRGCQAERCGPPHAWRAPATDSRPLATLPCAAPHCRGGAPAAAPPAPCTGGGHGPAAGSALPAGAEAALPAAPHATRLGHVTSWGTGSAPPAAAPPPAPAQPGAELGAVWSGWRGPGHERFEGRGGEGHELTEGGHPMGRQATPPSLPGPAHPRLRGAPGYPAPKP